MGALGDEGRRDREDGGGRGGGGRRRRRRGGGRKEPLPGAVGGEHEREGEVGVLQDLGGAWKAPGHRPEDRHADCRDPK